MGSGSPWVAWVTRVGGNCARPIKSLHNLIFAALTASCRQRQAEEEARQRRQRQAEEEARQAAAAKVCVCVCVCESVHGAETTRGG